MSYLLDTDICSAYLKDDRRVAAKFMMHYGGLHLSVTTVGELLTWARRATAPMRRLAGVLDLIRVSNIQSVDLVVAETFGTLRAGLFDRGRIIGSQDLWNASIAIVHNLIVVTHSTQDYQNIPGLRIEDWLSPEVRIPIRGVSARRLLPSQAGHHPSTPPKNAVTAAAASL